MLRLNVKTVLVGAVLAATAVEAQVPDRKAETVATVQVGKGSPAIAVHDIAVEFEFCGVGLHSVSPYKRQQGIPLTNGQIVGWASVAASEFSAVETDDGYKAQAKINTKEGRVIESLIKEPSSACVHLVGRTDDGSYRLQIDDVKGLKGKQVIAILTSGSSLRTCTLDKTHVYSNPAWNFCPIDGGRIK